MLITPNPPIEVSPSTWRFTWSGTGPFQIYLRGERIAVISDTEFEVFEPDTSIVPVIEIATADDDAPAEVRFPPRLAVSWRQPSGVSVAYYRIEQDIDGTWTLLDVVVPNAARYHLWFSEPLADDTTHSLKVAPVDASGYQHTALEVEVLLVRVPDVPRVAITYDAQTGQATAALA